MVRDFSKESLSHDPIHGYIPFISKSGLPAGEVAEQEIIDHPWVQRMRQIHQLQTAWWVFPSAEHTRFQHVLGRHAPGLGGLRPLVRVAPRSVPRRPFAGLCRKPAADGRPVARRGPRAVRAFFRRPLSRPVRHHARRPRLARDRARTGRPAAPHPPQSARASCSRSRSWSPSRSPGSSGGPAAKTAGDGQPDWLRKLRALFSGIYTVDNMDFVLRDAYMSGYNTRAFDLWRLLHYTFFTDAGLTIHSRGLPTLITFIERGPTCFARSISTAPCGRIDLALEDVFPQTMKRPLPGQSAGASRRLSQRSPSRRFWSTSGAGQTGADPELRELGAQWAAILSRNVALEDGLRADDQLPHRALPSGRRFFPSPTWWSNACGASCRRAAATFRCGSTWPGTITGPAAGVRRAGRTSCSTRPTAFRAGAQRRRAVPLAAHELRHLPRLLARTTATTCRSCRRSIRCWATRGTPRRICDLCAGRGKRSCTSTRSAAASFDKNGHSRGIPPYPAVNGNRL